MALILSGKTPCGLCGEVMAKDAYIVAFPAFLPQGHELWRFSDGAFHHVCWEREPSRPRFECLYEQYRAIWETRPMGRRTLEEMNAWSREAFKNWPPLV